MITSQSERKECNLGVKARSLSIDSMKLGVIRLVIQGPRSHGRSTR